MLVRGFVLGVSVAGLLAVSSLPASAQFADFFCSTLSIGCEPPPPPPPPPPPIVEPMPAPVKHVHHAKKKMAPKHTAKKDDSAAPAAPAPAAPDGK